MRVDRFCSSAPCPSAQKGQSSRDDLSACAGLITSGVENAITANNLVSTRPALASVANGLSFLRVRKPDKPFLPSPGRRCDSFRDANSRPRRASVQYTDAIGTRP